MKGPSSSGEESRDGQRVCTEYITAGLIMGPHRKDQSVNGIQISLFPVLCYISVLFSCSAVNFQASHLISLRISFFNNKRHQNACICIIICM